MHVGDRTRPPLSPQEGWLSDGRQVLHFRPRRYDRWSQSDLADESASKPERQKKRAKADLVFHAACLCCGCDRALSQKLLVGVRIGALFLPWKRKSAQPVRGEMRSSEADGVKGEEELIALWQEACGASAGLTHPSREGTPMRGPTRESSGELTLENLEQIDAIILRIADQPTRRD
jgi:hypothetical protein